MAALWHSSIIVATSRGAMAHSAEMLLTGLNVKSYPATALVAGLLFFAIQPESSESSDGSRWYSFQNMPRATDVRMRARTSSSIAAHAHAPMVRL
ncbi:Uncharacterised protein [Mycobacteroides abscessus subsp. massiliense]|nr:Uncharacterised protein [Mycobacteroides abscessus subsp. massiliense]